MSRRYFEPVDSTEIEKPEAVARLHQLTEAIESIGRLKDALLDLKKFDRDELTAEAFFRVDIKASQAEDAVGRLLDGVRAHLDRVAAAEQVWARPCHVATSPHAAHDYTIPAHLAPAYARSARCPGIFDGPAVA